MKRKVKLSHLLAAGLFAAATVGLAGCGGGGSSEGASADGALVQGRAGLSKLASGQQPTNAQTLQSTLDLFQQAVQQDPNSAEAHFGAAVCLAGVVSQQADGYTGDAPSVPALEVGAGGAANGGASGALPAQVTTGGDVPPAPPGKPVPQPIPPLHVRGLIWNLGANLANPYGLLQMLAPISDLRLGMAAFYGYPQDAQDVARRQKMLDDLNTVEQHLQTVEQDPNFSVTLTFPAPTPAPNPPTPPEPPAPPIGISGGGSGQPSSSVPMPPAPPMADKSATRSATRSAVASMAKGDGGAATPPSITIGLPEVYLFDAYVNSLRAQLALSLAYVRDPGTSWQPPIPPTIGIAAPMSVGGGNAGSGIVSPGGWTPASLDKNGDGKLTPDEYLPPSPFLTLRDAKYLQTAQQAMQAVASREQQGIDGVFARPSDGSGGFLVPNSDAVHQALQSVKDNVLPLIQQAATGPVTIQVPQWTPLMLAEAGQGTAASGGTASATAAASSKSAENVANQGGRGIFSDIAAALPIGGTPQPPTMLKVTFDLAAWFAKPPADLKVFAPTLTLGPGGWPDPSKTTYPDPTFGGLFPDGLTADLPF